MPTLSVAIDARKAKEGAKQFQQAADMIGKSAQQAEKSVKKLGEGIGKGFKQRANAGLEKMGVGRLRGRLAGLPMVGGAIGGMSNLGMVGVGAGIGAGMLGAAAFRQASKVAQMADQYHKLSLKLGMTTEFLSEMQHAAALSGIEFAALTGAFEKANEALGEFVSIGTGPAVEGLKLLSPELTTLIKQGETVEKLFPKIIDDLNALQDPGQRTFAAGRIFGGGGIPLLQMAAGGSAGVAAMRAEALSAGVSVSQNLANAGADFNDAMERFSIAWEGLERSLSTTLLPKFTDLINGARFLLAPTRIQEIGKRLLEIHSTLNRGSATIGPYGAVGYSDLTQQQRRSLHDEMRELTEEKNTLNQIGRAVDRGIPGAVGRNRTGLRTPTKKEPFIGTKAEMWMERQNAIHRENLALQIELSDAWGTWTQQLRNGTHELKMLLDATEGWGNAVGRAAEEALFSGQSIKEVFSNLLMDISRETFSASVTAPLAGLVTSGARGLIGSAMPTGGGGTNVTQVFPAVTDSTGFRETALQQQSSGFRGI